MRDPLYNGWRIRYSFGKLKVISEPPYLLFIQRESFRKFLQEDVQPDKRENVGIENVFRESFPVVTSDGLLEIRYKFYSITPPTISPEECIEKGFTYSCTLRVNLELVIYEETEDGKQLREIRELNDVFVGEIPYMTETGSFVVNGSQKVVVNQLHRSPGVFFEVDKIKHRTTGKPYYIARIIPYRGSWLDFEFDNKDRIIVKINKKRKVSATVLLKACGYTEEEIVGGMYPIETVYVEGDNIYKEVTPALRYQNSNVDIEAGGRIIVRKGSRFTDRALDLMLKGGINKIPVDEESIYGKVLASDVKDPHTGEIIAEFLDEVTPTLIETFRNRKVKEFRIVYFDSMYVFPSVIESVKSDPARTQEEAIDEIFKKVRPSEPASFEEKKKYIEDMFFNPEIFDLSGIGRHKINMKLNRDVPLEQTALTQEDLFEIIKKLFWLRNERGHPDDIDHMGNRRVRSVGELLEMYFLVGMKRVVKITSDRLATLPDISSLRPGEIINFKPAITAIKDFFNTNSLCQFMDQVNPLAEVTQKRRLSALGPGGLARERAGYEVRDVHPSHYGKICPIETPEGQNIGIITSLASYAKIDKFGFIQAPYRRVVNGKPTNEIVYLNAIEEEKYIIAPGDTPLDEEGKIRDEFVMVRKGGEALTEKRENVQFMDLIPSQLVSVSSSLICFLEHDDANRALMGSNMQRQAVPLFETEAPLVGTGMESKVALDSGYTVVADYSGYIEYVDGSQIVLRVLDDDYPDKENEIITYKLKKYERSNQKTCINQKPVVRPGDFVKRGQVIADGPAIDKGELALGRNVLVAFMPWSGYNYEDSILISERLVKDDVFTSIHIEEFECEARDTKLGREEITRDIPGVREEDLLNLGEDGIVRIGARVKPGDILVGKVTPKGESILSPEEKLLRAIFGDKAGDYKDTSLRVSPGVEGVVIGVHVFVRKSEDSKEAKEQEIRVTKVLIDEKQTEIEQIKQSLLSTAKSLLIGRKAKSNITHQRKVIVKRGSEVKEDHLDRIPYEKWSKVAEFVEGGSKIIEEVKKVINKVDEQIDIIEAIYKRKMEKLQKGDELPVGVHKRVKVFVASLRKIQVGDKMAGRHGNKGVISKVLPIEDMPFLPDGTPVDIVLNPLGVPSRMNLGQVFETMLGWACKELGKKIGEIVDGYRDPKKIREVLKKMYDNPKITKMLNSLSDDEVVRVAMDLERGVPVASPIFDGAKEDEIRDWLRKAGLPESGTVQLYDGITGEPFHQETTVGYMYMMKLDHMVEDKIHARATGPYSLVTQQPLGGKARMGGQRLGEMEVWALEAYGASNLLQEFLTVKSDDVIGRRLILENIKKGKYDLQAGLPESFHVLIKELQSLSLDVTLTEDEEKEEVFNG